MEQPRVAIVHPVKALISVLLEDLREDGHVLARSLISLPSTELRCIHSFQAKVHILGLHIIGHLILNQLLEVFPSEDVEV
jgi:hypothetical protein